MSALDESLRIAAEEGLDPEFPPEVEAEVERIAADPGIDDPGLDDLTALPFATLDEPASKDLDQAVYLERRRDGFTVWYAIADAAWFVRPGTALFAEALSRGTSFYLPGLVVPMLPRRLSEGLVSLNPDVERRAMVFVMPLGRDGRMERVGVRRARIRSRCKTSYEAVQAWLDGETGPPSLAVAKSLALLPDVGEARLRHAEERDVVRVRRREIGVRIGARGLRFVAFADLRDDVERYNEQISLMCNISGARLLQAGEGHPIFRVHDPPEPRRERELRARFEDIVGAHGLDGRLWSWGDESLADYLRRLPDGPVSRAIHRQAAVSSGRAAFSAVPGLHHGVGADAYARFSAPMREIVGVWSHLEAWRHLGGAPPGEAHERAQLRDLVIAASERARDRQRRVDDRVNQLVIDGLFERDLARADRPVRYGVVMGITATKVHVQLDEPPIDVKVYVRHLGSRPRLEGAVLKGEGLAIRVGDRVGVRVTGRDERWALEIV